MQSIAIPEIVRLRGLLAQAAGCLEALHPDNIAELTDAEVARLYNATLAALYVELGETADA